MFKIYKWSNQKQYVFCYATLPTKIPNTYKQDGKKNMINKNWAFYMHSNMNPEFIFSCFLEAKQVSSKSYPDIC